MKTLKTIDACFKALKLDVKKNLPDVSNLPKQDRKAVIDHYKLVKVIEAHNKINDNWQPNWNDGSWKYYPWFRVKASDKNPTGSGLSFGVCVFTYSYTGVGSRLCLPSRELAEHVGKKFIDLYTSYYLIQK